MSKNFRIIASKDGSRQFDSSNSMHAHNRVNFKSSRGNSNRSRGNFRKFNQAPVSLLKLIEDDISMEGGSNYHDNRQTRGGYRGRGGRGGGQFPRTGPSEVPFSKSGWYRITIPHARDLERDFILKSIHGLTKTPIMPINFRYEDRTAVFNLKGAQEAGSVKEVSRRITTPNGYKMIILVNPCPTPPTEINADVIAKVKDAMSRRYKAEVCFLDLSSFTKDPDLLSQNISLSFSRQKFTNNLLDIIGQNIPELKILDISNNEITGLSMLSTLFEKAPHLTSLNLANNRITSESELSYIKKLKLEEIMLEGNHVQTKFKDKQLYIRAVRQKFPNVLRLDGLDLPPPISFNIEATELPPSKGSYFDNEVIQGQICLFVQQYYSVYDSDSRDGLIGAYHDQATFSMTCFYNRAQNSSQNNISLTEYLKYSRNLRRVDDNEKLFRVKSGRDNVINLLKKLPSTSHDPQSFSVDVTLVTPGMLIFSIKGVFVETSSSSSTSSSNRVKPMRHFNRLVVAVPNVDGIAILNEMLTITNLNLELHEKYKSEMQSMASKTEKEQPSSSTSSSSSTSQSSIMTPIQKEMVISFSQQSGMNEHYSIMCLSGNSWNFEQAAIKFSELQQSNSIPAEAFIK